jgi:FMN phosphatase YigB (HAD superfamily)
MFKISAERIGGAAENILYVGDRIDMDIKPTLKICFEPVIKAAYTNAGKKPPNGAWEITHISKLPALIKKINGKNIAIADTA